MAETGTETAATAATGTTEAPKGPSPLDELKDIPPDQIVQAVRFVQRLGTPEGEAEILSAVEKRAGREIAKRYLANDPSVIQDLNSKERRAIRRSAATKQEREAGLIDLDTEPAEDVPNPAEQAHAAAKAAEARAAKAEALAITNAEAIRLGPLLVAVANKNPVVADNMEPWQDEVVAKLTSGNPRYQGFSKASIERASEDVLNEWRRKGEMAGLRAPAAPTPAATSLVTGPKIEDIEARLKTATTKEARIAMANAIMAELPEMPRR